MIIDKKLTKEYNPSWVRLYSYSRQLKGKKTETRYKIEFQSIDNRWIELFDTDNLDRAKIEFNKYTE